MAAESNLDTCSVDSDPLVREAAGRHNAFPSAHVAGAVVALIFAWRHAPKLGLSLPPLVTLLCLGAVYDRYHYLSDVGRELSLGQYPPHG
jgi:membrane-associated phospholipid phosphatase